MVEDTNDERLKCASVCNTVDVLENRIKTLEEVAGAQQKYIDALLRRLHECKSAIETEIWNTDASYRNGLLRTLAIFRKYFPELEDK